LLNGRGSSQETLAQRCDPKLRKADLTVCGLLNPVDFSKVPACDFAGIVIALRQGHQAPPGTFGFTDGHKPHGYIDDIEGISGVELAGPFKSGDRLVCPAKPGEAQSGDMERAAVNGRGVLPQPPEGLRLLSAWSPGKLLKPASVFGGEDGTIGHVR